MHVYGHYRFACIILPALDADVAFSLLLVLFLFGLNRSLSSLCLAATISCLSSIGASISACLAPSTCTRVPMCLALASFRLLQHIFLSLSLSLILSFPVNDIVFTLHTDLAVVYPDSCLHSTFPSRRARRSMPPPKKMQSRRMFGQSKQEMLCNIKRARMIRDQKFHP